MTRRHVRAPPSSTFVYNSGNQRRARPLIRSAGTPVTTTDVAWNFETVLFSRTGSVYRRYATAVDPRAISADVAYLLAH